MGVLHGDNRWYAAGLAFECVQCGRCCAGPAEGYVWVTDAEIEAIAKHLAIPPDRFRAGYLRRVRGSYSLVERPENRDCIFLSEGDGVRRCDIYAVRPAQCRAWPFWPSNLTSPRAWAAAGARCPGINRGALLTCQEIELRRRTTGE